MAKIENNKKSKIPFCIWYLKVFGINRILEFYEVYGIRYLHFYIFTNYTVYHNYLPIKTPLVFIAVFKYPSSN